MGIPEYPGGTFLSRYCNSRPQGYWDPSWDTDWPNMLKSGRDRWSWNITPALLIFQLALRLRLGLPPTRNVPSLPQRRACPIRTRRSAGVIVTQRSLLTTTLCFAWRDSIHTKGGAFMLLNGQNHSRLSMNFFEFSSNKIKLPLFPACRMDILNQKALELGASNFKSKKICEFLRGYWVRGENKLTTKGVKDLRSLRIFRRSKYCSPASKVLIGGWLVRPQISTFCGLSVELSKFYPHTHANPHLLELSPPLERVKFTKWKWVSTIGINSLPDQFFVSDPL